MKLWKKDYNLDKAVEAFTVGNDYLLDQKLVVYDCFGSIAQAKMLAKIKVLSGEEEKKLVESLKSIIKLSEEGKFKILQEDEDCHTAIENHLIKETGEAGKKIHAGRSRNDQVLTALRLYTKAELLHVMSLVTELVKSLQKFAEKNRDVPMPGYTHMQKAMPSSVGLWGASFAESLEDDFEALKTAYNINNQSPLGSAAGFGSILDTDRKFTADLLGFKSVQNNVLYVQNSRGKTEVMVLDALSYIMSTINKLATDLLLFTMQEFQYFSLPKTFLTGSSIMPQKYNYDVLELLRAKSNLVAAKGIELRMITGSLPSGYNRDFQLIKLAFFESFDTTIESVAILTEVIKCLQVNKDKLVAACTPELFMTDAALKLVKGGMPFREAYQQVTGKPVTKIDTVKAIKSRSGIGMPGNLNLDKEKVHKFEQLINSEESSWNSVKMNLMDWHG